MKNKKISIICAVHNEQDTVLLFYERFLESIKTIRMKYEFELIFTNNRSTDNTLSLIKELMIKDPSVKVITLSRNFGYQASIQCGMSYASGICIITIDVDCEDPPELIPELLKKWEEGYDIVYGIRTKRPESRFLTGLRNLFYKILKFTSDTEIILNMAEFGLISNFVRDVIINNNNTFPFLRTEIAYSGFNTYGIIYDRERRIAGETHYNFWRMTLFAIGGILSSSTFLLRLAVYVLPIILLFNILSFYLSYIYSSVYFRFIVLMDICYLIYMITIFGIYLARLYKNSINRPLYIIDWKLSFGKFKYYKK